MSIAHYTFRVSLHSYFILHPFVGAKFYTTPRSGLTSKSYDYEQSLPNFDTFEETVFLFQKKKKAKKNQLPVFLYFPLNVANLHLSLCKLQHLEKQNKTKNRNVFAFILTSSAWVCALSMWRRVITFLINLKKRVIAFLNLKKRFKSNNPIVQSS